MTAVRVHQDSNPGTAHPPIDRAKVPSMDEWKAMTHNRPSALDKLLGWLR